jgi:protein-tyrosine-phosphatase
MAEAIAKHAANDVIEASSAGLVPFGEIPATTLAVLAERGFSASGQYSKSLRHEDLPGVDLIVNLTGRSGESLFTAPAPPVEDWDVGDPYGYSLPVYRAICDQIEERVADLAKRLRQGVKVQETA